RGPWHHVLRAPARAGRGPSRRGPGQGRVNLRRAPLPLVLWGAIALRGGGLAVGLGLLLDYKRTPGEAASAPPLWPSTSSLPRDPGRATLVLFAHPRCPCTRASLSELEALLAHVSGGASSSLNPLVVMARPPGVDAAWTEDGELWRAARRIPGVTVVR